MQFAIAIAQARLHARVKRQAEELERRVQERTADLPLDLSGNGSPPKPDEQDDDNASTPG